MIIDGNFFDRFDLGSTSHPKTLSTFVDFAIKIGGNFP
jgi:hypothetical protein